jgi:hypothetical protein
MVIESKLMQPRSKEDQESNMGRQENETLRGEILFHCRSNDEESGSWF